MKETTVVVDRRHIDGSYPDSSCMCAIAKALREQHPRDFMWYVGLTKIYRWPGQPIELPQKAIDFIAEMLSKRKDKNGLSAVAPITFMINE